MKLSTKHLDKTIGAIIIGAFLYSFLILFYVYIDGKDIGDWIWERHQHPFSWYSRPLFVIGACYYAYRQNFFYIIAILLLLFTSLYWFPAPENIPAQVTEYLAWEKELFFENPNKLPLYALIVVVIVFLIALFAAFWKRSFIFGIILINTGTLLKIAVSMISDPIIGKASIVPSLSSLVFINIVFFIIWKMKK